MGRLWQTVILLQQFTVFEYLPFVALIKENQKEYDQALSQSDKTGQSTPFITFMLGIVQSSLAHRLEQKVKPLDAGGRLGSFRSHIKSEYFSRSDYLRYIGTISSATGSRDLKLG